MIFTDRMEVWWKVLFSQACVIPSGHRDVSGEGVGGCPVLGVWSGEADPPSKMAAAVVSPHPTDIR